MSLVSKKLSLILSLVLLGALASTAVADDEAEKNDPDASQADQEQEKEEPRQRAEISADVKAAAGVEDREPVEVSDRFDAGANVIVWSRIDNGNGTTVRHVWTRNGDQVWERAMDIGSNRWRTWSRSGVSAGEYTVEVVTEDGTILGQAAFTVE